MNDVQKFSTEVNNLIQMLRSFGVLQLVNAEFTLKHNNTAPYDLLKEQVDKVQDMLNLFR